MLAIVSALQHWCYYLEGAKHTVTVFTDHKNLEVFMSSKVLNRRQARWAELLAGYNFVLAHIPGPTNPADGPSHRPNYAEDQDLPVGTLLPPSSCPHILNISTVAKHNYRFSASLSVFTPLRMRLINVLRSDPVVCAQKQRTDPPYAWRNDLLCHNTAIYIPESLRLEMLHMHHDDPLTGHFGESRTLELLSWNYWFPSMALYVKNYVSTWNPRAKPSRHQRHSELMPLPVPAGPWKGITCDFITDLPTSKGYDTLLIFVDRFTKMTHLLPCNKTTDAPQFARLFVNHIIRLHGILESLVSDHGSLFTSHFWKALSQMLGLKGRLSTAFHPQTDGQTERMNQTIEQYLRIYCNYQQDDSYHHLSLAEYAYNIAFQSTIRCSLFYANYGYHRQFQVLVPESLIPDIPSAKEYAEKLQHHYDSLAENVKSTQDTPARYYNAKHKRIEFAVGNQVWLLSPNIQTERPSKKLDWKRLGPYKVTQCLGVQAYRLELPASMKIHPLFHISLLELYKPSNSPGRTQPPPPPVVFDDDLEWEVEQILDSSLHRRKLFYKVRWKGYPPSEDTWQPATDLANALDHAAKFHSKYPRKPRMNPQPSAPIPSA